MSNTNYPSQYIRNHFIKSLKQRVALLDKWRTNATLTSVERQAVWLLLSDLVTSKVKTHYKRRNVSGEWVNGRPRDWFELPSKQHDGYDYHVERMLMLAEFMKVHADRSVGWCISTWKIRFQQFEELRQMHLKGVSVTSVKLDDDDYGDGSHKSKTYEQSSPIRDSILFRSAQRNLETSGDEATPQNILEVTTAGLTPQKQQTVRCKLARFLVNQAAMNPLSLDSVMEGVSV